MHKGQELQEIIFHLLEMQIKFGVHRCGESLPTIAEASRYFLASVDTVRLAYVRLKREGYISLSTSVGATVKVRYGEEEIREHIQAFFSCRKNAMLDFARAARPLFGRAQWLAFTGASPETLDELERSNLRKDVPAPYRMSRQYLLLYGALGDDLFMRLIWQMFLFFQGPFMSIPQNARYFELETTPAGDVLTNLIRLCRAKDREGLWLAIDNYEERRFDALRRFYDTQIREEPDTAQIGFNWNPYKKASQLCYSICMDLMMKIRLGEYPAGSFLPSLDRLAREKRVSLNTIRRTLALMAKLGAVESVNGIGTKALPLFDCPLHCDFTNDVIQKRLLDFAQGFHILALSCRACARLTVDSMDAGAIGEWIGELETLKSTGVYEDVIVTCYSAISRHAPYQAIRTVYCELTKQLFWGAPLRDLHGNRERTRAYFRPYLESLIAYLTHGDAEGFSEKLEELQRNETKLAAEFLVNLGIQEAAGLL